MRWEHITTKHLTPMMTTFRKKNTWTHLALGQFMGPFCPIFQGHEWYLNISAVIFTPHITSEDTFTIFLKKTIFHATLFSDVKMGLNGQKGGLMGKKGVKGRPKNEHIIT